MSVSQTLAEFFGVDRFDFESADQTYIIQSTAHVVIDVQQFFADSEKGRGNPQTEKTAIHISNLVPQFREAGFRTYWVYLYVHERTKEHPERCCGGFYKNEPMPEDELIPKDCTSAFQGSDIKQRLHAQGIKNIIVSGFNASSCVQYTVLDGLSEGFNVCVLRDAIENDRLNQIEFSKRKSLRNMAAHGAFVQTSSQLLNVVQRVSETETTNQPPSPNLMQRILCNLGL